MSIEFTDRYGGHAPSWLRGCHDQCEAMGVVPIFVAVTPARPDEVRMDDEDDPRWLAAWDEAHAKEHSEACDGWHFVKCSSCGGSGRVSWIVSVARIPRWLWKGVRFYGWAMDPLVSPDGWTWRQRFANYLNAAFLADLRSLRR
jgi:hypothetical protein